MRYLTYSELIFINGKVLNDERIMSGTTKVRDIDLLLGSEQRPQASAFGQDAYATLTEKACVLMHSLARNHPFKDGNKRTATLALLMILEVNGARVVWDESEALGRIIALAEGRSEWEIMAQWLQTIPCQASPTPDLAQDTALIDGLMTRHAWLLSELAKC